MKKLLNNAWLLLSTVILFTACSKMDATYREFIEGGQVKYAGKADSVQVLSGRNRMILTWQASADPKVNKAKIYWNNRSDSTEVPINPDDKIINVPFNNMPEGTYVFEIITSDKQGNRSLKVEKIGKVYGDIYQRSLLNRPIDKTSISNDTLKVEWGSAPDTSVIYTELIYNDADAVQHTERVSPKASVSLLPNFIGGTSLKFRTAYLPNQLAIDTFYTAYDTRRIKGARIELSKEGWTATASSYDNRNGRVDRLPEKAIDGNVKTSWVNLVGSTKYPHSITIDMSKLVSDIEGVSFYLNKEKEAPKQVRLLVSKDNVTWTTMGVFIFEYVAGDQYIDFPTTHSFRYFQVIAEEPAGTTDNIILPELGVFTR